MASELDKESCIEVVNILKNNGVSLITFGGGESLVRKDFWAVAKHSIDNNISVRVISNGTTLNDRNVQKLAQIKISKVLISLDGPNAVVHDKFRDKQGLYNTVLQGIALCNKYSLPVMVLTTFTKLNAHLIDDFVNLLNHYSVGEWRINEVKAFGNAIENSKDIPFTMKDAESVHRKLFQVKDNYNGRIIFDSKFAALQNEKDVRTPGCHCAKLSFCLRPNGDISPCVYLIDTIGNILTDNFSKVWQNSELVCQIRNKKSTGKCIGCELFNKCKGGCFARAHSLTGDIESPDPLCWIKQESL